MANVIREDVVKVSFDVDVGGLSKLDKEINKISGGADKSLGKDPFSNLTKGAKDASKNVQDVGQKLQNAAPKAKTLGTAMKDMAKASFEKLKSGLKTVATKLGEIAKKAGGAAYNGLKKLAGISFKALGVGLAGAATGIAAIVKQSASAFGEFEQLKGGMEKIFDEADISGIMADANNAYKTLGLSAEQYLSVINQTGASFAATMGDQKGYETAKTGMTAISDYATGTGRNIDELSEKFSLITRSTSSYQSIADQFSGILPATSKDFLAQAQAAGVLEKKYTKLTDVPVAEYQQAVSKMFEKGVADLGLAGNTAMEAEKTFTGSLGMMKAAWGNLLTAIGSGENLDQAFNNFIYSAETFGTQLIPVLERSLQGIGVVVEKIAPIIANKLPDLISKLLPPLVSAAGQLIASLVANLPSIIAALIPAITQAGAQIVSALYQAFTGKEMDSSSFDKIKIAIDKVVNAAKIGVPIIIGLVGAFKLFNGIKTAVTFVKGFATGIGNIVSKVGGGLAGKLTTTAGGMTATGTASATSGAQVGTAATSFMKMGVAVLAIGGGLALAGVGFALLAQSAIALAGAGGAAIAVMFGMVAAIAVLVAIVGLFGGALIGGAVGFVIFSAGLLICAAAAYVFAMAVERMTPPLLMLIPVVGQVVTQIVNAVGTVLVNCIQAAGDAISQILDSIGNIFLKFGEGVKTIVTGIGDAISGVLDSIAGIFDSIGNAALNAGLGFEKVANGLRMISEMSLTELITSLGAVGDAMKTMAENGEGLTLAGQGMQTLVAAFMSLATTGAMVSTVITGVATALNQLTMTMPNLVAILPSLVAPLTMVASQFMLFATTVTSAVTSITMTLGLLTGVVTILAVLANALNTGTTALNEMSGASEQLSKTFEASMKGMVNAAQSGTTRILSLIKQMLSDIQTAFKSVNLQSVGEQMMNGLIRGINNKRAELISLIRSVANEANREWQAIQAIHSPSKVWEQFGEYQIEGNIVGIENKLPQLRRTVDDVGEAAIPYSGRYSPEKATYTNRRTSNSEYNSYSPVFNFNISGNGDVRATQRAVKRAAKEALREMFESMDRRSPSLQRI